MDKRIPIVKSEYHPALDGPEIVFLHGFMGSCQDWNSILPYLRDRGCGFLLIDLPGHGDSQGLSDQANWSMENTAVAVLNEIKKHDLDKPAILGYSMGGRLALYLIVLFSDHFSCAILESASPGLNKEEERKRRIFNDAQLAQKIQNTNFEQFLETWYQQPIFASLKNHPQFSQLIRKRKKNHSQLLAKSVAEMGTGRQPNLWPKLDKVKIPLLLVIGEMDTKFRAIAKQMLSDSPNMQQVVFTKCGHNVHFEQPEAFAKEIFNFIINR